ncbi:TrkA family potassium uptake protein [Streptomyces sp. B6B3]|uniref:potassium channel family protein n=1 Tax=Streptomyces sp. B6B3 TaxID=3153570 RepID=UPI00325E202C
MRVLVVGCGRVGTGLVAQLTAEGNDVRVIDRSARARHRLPAAFTGSFHEGNGYHRTVLEEAGIEHADALVAATSADTSNIVSARVARDVYRVPTVLARMDDPRHATAYQELGIPTVAGVRWTVHEIHRLLTHRHLAPELAFGHGETLLLRARTPDHLVGRRLAEFDVAGEIRVVEVTRAGRSLVPGEHTRIRGDDLVTFVVAATSLARLRGFLGKDLGT